MNNPAMWIGLWTAIAAVLTSAGIEINGEVNHAIEYAIQAAVILFGSYLVRNRVTPTAKVEQVVDDKTATAIYRTRL